MSLTAYSFNRYFSATGSVARHGVFTLVSIGILHLTAIAIMAFTETSFVSKLAFILTWGVVNFFWLALLRRPAVAAALSLVFVVLLIALSEFKYQVLFMTLNFVDLMIIDPDSVAYMFMIFPSLGWTVAAIAAVVISLLALIWRFDMLRIRLRYALVGFAACVIGSVTLSLWWEMEPHESFYGNNYVSTFSRTGVAAISELMTHGMLEADAAVADRLKSTADTTCAPAAKAPHIIMVHDESSFDIRSAPGIKTPPGYGRHFRSFDGKARKFMVEGVGGASWYAEYNVLTGLSARSFGRFSYFVTRIAANRVTRGLPDALRRCGYQTRSIYPALGAFMSARSFQTTVGIQQFRDKKDLGAKGLEPDKFYYDKALQMLGGERGNGPMFLYVYLAANHFPWNYRFRPELAPQWKDLENPPLVNEYLRRQTMSAQDYAAFLADLKTNFPGESFLLVRYGDHQPEFSAAIMEPSLDNAAIAQRMMKFDPKYYATYYAIDAVNFKPADVSSALDRLDGPYLPLVVQEAAGLPLDPSFAEQKDILKRCEGVFYACNGGAEARRFNRLLIDAGLIKQL
jgi:phosphoglycerol transferase MdoB-like AlkP superfamily enzyme